MNIGKLLGLNQGFQRFVAREGQNYAVCQNFEGKVCEFPVTPEQMTGISMWQKGAMIQDALPDLTKEQREMLLTGNTQEMWDAIWKEDEDG